MGGLEDPARLEALAYREEEREEGEEELKGGREEGEEEEDAEGKMLMWRAGEEGNAMLPTFDLTGRGESSEEGGEGKREGGREGEDVPRRLVREDLILLKNLLEGGKEVGLEGGREEGQFMSSPRSASSLFGPGEDRGRDKSEEEEEEWEYVYEDELEEGDEFQYLAEEEEASLFAMRERGNSPSPSSSSSPSSSPISSRLSPEETKEGLATKEDKNTRFLVRGPDGRFFAPSSGRRLIPLDEEGGEEVMKERTEEGKEQEEKGGRKWRGLGLETRIPLRGPPGIVQ